MDEKPLNSEEAECETYEATSFIDPQLLKWYEDLGNRVYRLNSEITINTLELVDLIIRWNREDIGIDPKDRKPIRVLITSGGGDLEIEEQIVSIIAISKTPVYGIAMGIVGSAASLIYLSCHKRFALPNAYVVLHHGSCEEMSGTYEMLQASFSDYRQRINLMEKFYLDHTLYTEDEIKKGLTTDWYIRGDELVDKGLVHEWVTNIDIFM